ncbi:Hypothetical predicted protein [Octopus vulgaris]|uniref:Uncharacterized protein n=1 Tax=Octopus vulgaris TaxID=6645 RepID=A0AA36FIP3_OCTVU|nr:Hypothetical predicted protein [Octopus vulgaris]
MGVGLLKWHFNQYRHLDARSKFGNLKEGTIFRILTETPIERKSGVVQEAWKKKLRAALLIVLVDNVIPAVEMNTSMHPIQGINLHLAKYVNIPQSCHDKNYALKFVEYISVVVQRVEEICILRVDC